MDASPLLFRLDPHLGVPLFRQIVDQVRLFVATGRLRPGDRLPSVRVLSETLVVNPTTVQRAFLELEKEGVVRSRRGLGTFVASRAPAMPDAERRERAQRAARTAAAELAALGLDREEARRILCEAVSDTFAAPDEEGRPSEGDKKEVP